MSSRDTTSTTSRWILSSDASTTTGSSYSSNYIYDTKTGINKPLRDARNGNKKVIEPKSGFPSLFDFSKQAPNKLFLVTRGANAEVDSPNGWVKLISAFPFTRKGANGAIKSFSNINSGKWGNRTNLYYYELVEIEQSKIRIRNFQSHSYMTSTDFDTFVAIIDPDTDKFKYGYFASPLHRKEEYTKYLARVWKRMLNSGYEAYEFKINEKKIHGRL